MEVFGLQQRTPRCCSLLRTWSSWQHRPEARSWWSSKRLKRRIKLGWNWEKRGRLRKLLCHPKSTSTSTSYDEVQLKRRIKLGWNWEKRGRLRKLWRHPKVPASAMRRSNSRAERGYSLSDLLTFVLKGKQPFLPCNWPNTRMPKQSSVLVT